ncbi:MAG: hypothetical protein AB2L20_30625 [Mangrovibacterium sp.]
MNNNIINRIFFIILIMINVFLIYYYDKYKDKTNFKINELSFLNGKYIKDIQDIEDILIYSIFYIDINIEKKYSNSLYLYIPEDNCSICMGNIINWLNEFHLLNPGIKTFYLSQKAISSLDEINIKYIYNDNIVSNKSRSIIWYIDGNNKIKYAIAIDKNSLNLIMKYFNQLKYMTEI